MAIDRDVVKNLEDALKVVDESNLPSAPSSDRHYPIVSEHSDPIAQRATSVDRYDIPSEPLRRSGGASGGTSRKTSGDTSDSKGFKPFRTSFLRRERPTLSTDIPRRDDSYDFMRDRDLRSNRNPEQDLDIGPPDFKMKFDFESAYRNIPEHKPFRLRREKRTGLVGGLLLAIFIICVSIVLASIMWMATTDILGFASQDELVNVQVPAGFTLEGITDMLYESGLIRHKALFIMYAEYSNAIEKITEGSYILNKNYDYRALVQGMTARAGVRVETSVTIPEGFTLAQIFSLLDAEGVCPADELWHTATYHDFPFHFLDRSTLGNRLRLEGFLFPDTYNFYMDSNPQQAILRMLREFNRRFTEEYVERADEMELSVHDIITIASLIEREAGDDEERPRIAAVIYNRLANPNFPRLEIDATIHYAIAGTTIPFSTRLESEFNTYIHEGLPPGPIASPGMPSIRAALFPDETNEYFYALNKLGTHNFFTNYNDHVNFVNSDEYGG